MRNCDRPALAIHVQAHTCGSLTDDIGSYGCEISKVGVGGPYLQVIAFELFTRNLNF